MKLSYLVAVLAITAATNVKADVAGVTAGIEMWQADPTLTAGDTGYSQSFTGGDENNTAV